MSEKESESETRFKHVLPGEHVYEGVLFFGYTPPDILDAVKEFEVRDEDVFLATYPKAGESNCCCYHCYRSSSCSSSSGSRPSSKRERWRETIYRSYNMHEEKC